MARHRRRDEDDEDYWPRRARSGRKRNSNLLPLGITIAMAVIVLVILVAVAALVVRHRSSRPTRPNAPSAETPGPSSNPRGLTRPPPAPAVAPPRTPAVAPLPTEPTTPQDRSDFAGPWPDFEPIPDDTVVLHIHGVATPAQHDAIIYTRLERIAPTQTATGFVAGERRGEK